MTKQAVPLSRPIDHPSVTQALHDLARNQVVDRLWNKDHTLWKSDPREIDNRLGWLTVVDQMRNNVAVLRTFDASVREAGVKDIVLLGMGGSSLGPEVLRCTFGPAKGFPRLWVLDSTVPGWVRQVTKAITPSRTLFLVASKSGGTVEVMSLFAHFWKVVHEAKGHRGGAQFVAITDPGTGLEKLGAERGFWQTFINPPDIGGRYSVLSYFGLVPAALLGLDIAVLLDRARAMATACRKPAPPDQNPGLYLGALMGMLASQGRDKVTVVTSPKLNSFGLWVEQLLAESTGKEGRGLIPVSQEPLVAPHHYGSDRLFVCLRLKSDANGTLDRHVSALQRAGHPVQRLDLQDRYDLGAEFFRWEFATAVAGHLLGIHPFDQPNVQESKDNTSRVLKETGTSGRLPIIARSSPQQGLERLLRHKVPGRYLAILAYTTPSKRIEAAMASLRKGLLVTHHLATTAGYGPRYLHSTGQLHKGGPNTGLFLELLDSMRPDLLVPGQPYTFGTLAQAQAIGDLQSLETHGCEAVSIAMGRDPAATLRLLARIAQTRTRSTRVSASSRTRKKLGTSRRRPRTKPRAKR